MVRWQIAVGVYTGILVGICSDRYDDGYKHTLYLPFIFFEFNTFYDD